ncbi:GNAT family N-acetyltransferase [Microbacterium sp. C7(2022)]|uniref:GNAT family N-acetyltransferase n=1 Tax=Microbacterium sp. C7(2022) TaxID=2992759 RepID=UPI00237B9A99|nr:GNAT family N-acetyltransferase [Microbacterium sp. C7(2022)]MDE0545348.1 GNAT family N-acetyltransferase [Microbacterium sp. C7(2022)]
MAPQLPDRVHAPADIAPANHPDVAVWRRASKSDLDAIHAVVAASDLVDHPSWVTTKGAIADLFDMPHVSADDALVAENAEGEIIAAGAVVREQDVTVQVRVSLRGAVTPEYRRRGIGTILGDWQYARALQVLAETDVAVEGVIEQYVHESNPGAAKIAGAHGMVGDRWFVVMERDLREPIPVLDVDEHVSMQQLTPERDDEARLARNDAFRDHWGSVPYSRETWGKLTGGDHFRHDLSTVADVDGRVAAFCLVSVNEANWEHRGARYGYIEYVGVVRDHRGEGLAPRVLTHTLHSMFDAGLEKAQLDVDTASPTGANTLYASLGFAEREREQVFTRRF